MAVEARIHLVSLTVMIGKVRLALSISEYFDPGNVESTYSKHASICIGTGIGTGVGAAVNFVAPGIGNAVGNAANKIVRKGSNFASKKLEQKKGSQKQRNIADLLEGYHKDEPGWTLMLIESFNTIFINYAVQVVM